MKINIIGLILLFFFIGCSKESLDKQTVNEKFDTPKSKANIKRSGASAQSVESIIFFIIAQNGNLNILDVKRESHLYNDLGLDEFKIKEILNSINSYYSIQISINDIDSFSTVGNLINRVISEVVPEKVNFSHNGDIHLGDKIYDLIKIPDEIKSAIPLTPYPFSLTGNLDHIHEKIVSWTPTGFEVHTFNNSYVTADGVEYNWQYEFKNTSKKSESPNLETKFSGVLSCKTTKIQNGVQQILSNKKITINVKFIRSNGKLNLVFFESNPINIELSSVSNVETTPPGGSNGDSDGCNSTECKMLKYIENRFDLKERLPNSISLDMNLSDIGLDELEYQEMIMGLEDEFGIEFYDSDLANLITLRDVLNFIISKG
ncbi:acyl carrier protein [uncultured Sphingobacterium sp.]|uniref:acyl carrier protein n=1 Tax=uncultured Sphingobacterium sp. TaxID=182688 RepID=UPI0025E95B21|nr:phosphopantetheine-binding protein [uncultured Sphingobacterium sp.]